MRSGSGWICCSGLEYPLNAAEAFVLGGALIIYDLGAGLAGLPGGEAELRKAQEWKDALATSIRRETDRAPTPHEMGVPLGGVRAAWPRRTRSTCWR